MRARVLGATIALLGVACAAHAAPPSPDGGGVFAANCAACHQAQGQGVPGAFPALAGNTFVQGDRKAVASVLLHGRGGMPNFSDDLTDGEIAAVLTYVRSSWGNHAPPIDATTVAALRSGATAPPEGGPSVLPGH